MKKIIVTLGAAGAVILPSAALIACGTSTKAKPDVKPVKHNKITKLDKTKNEYKAKIEGAVKKHLLSRTIADELEKDLEAINSTSNFGTFIDKAFVKGIDLKLSPTIYDEAKFKEYQDFSTKNNSVAYKSTTDDILQTANEADVNFYFVSAIAPFNNLLRLSMLTKTENHFFIIHGSEWENFERKVDTDALMKFYNEERVMSTDADGSNPKPAITKNSSVQVVNGSVVHTAAKFLKSVEDYAKKNPTKKINVWGNAHKFMYSGDEYRYLNFAGFKNINLQLIEDGSTNVRWFKDGTEAMLKDGSWTVDNLSYPYEAMAAPPNIKGVVRSWYSDKGILSLNKYADKTYNDKPYNFFEYKGLSDAIFNTRDINNSRLMGTWPKISGLNWEDAADIVAAASKANGHKSLIVLGSYGIVNEEEWIKQVWTTYHDKYNIFYKGHPGHMEHPLFVENWIKEDSPEGMYNLEPMISSEELTAQHVIPTTGAVAGEKYIQFDKVAVAGSSSAVTSAAFPNLDLTKDLIEVYGGIGKRYINPSINPKSTNWDGAVNIYKNVIGPNPTS